MSRLNPEKLHIEYLDSEELDILSRKYTLTHSDFTGDLFLSIGKEYDYSAIKKFYVRLMRDEVLAEWKKNEKYELHIYVHISGGFIFGGARFRNKIIRHHLPMVYEILKHAEKEKIEANSELQEAKLIVHFHSKRKKYNIIEDVGKLNSIK